ncbi:MAG: hypothetical protein ACLUZZ_06865 [Alistipes inops]
MKYMFKGCYRILQHVIQIIGMNLHFSAPEQSLVIFRHIHMFITAIVVNRNGNTLQFVRPRKHVDMLL